MLVIPTVVGFIFGICAAIILPRHYKSSTTLFVQEGKTDNPLFSNIAVSSTMSQRTQGIRETILGWDSIVKLVKQLNLDQNVKSSLEFERLVTRLRQEINISLRDGNIINLSYVADNPVKAQAVVKTVTDIFIERNVTTQNKETSDAIKFIEEQLHVYRGKIKSSEIADLKDKLNVLLVDSTEAHPLVKQLREQIVKKMDELKKDNLEFTEDERLTAATTNPMINEIKKTLDSMSGSAIAPDAPSANPAAEEKDIYKVMLLDKLDSVVARDVGVNESIYNSLLQRLETAKITQRLQSSKEGTRYTILEPPRIPLQPISPNIPLVVFLGLFLGLGSGVGLVFVSEFLDKSFLDVQEASIFLGVPLLGAISKINTVELLALEKEKNKWILFWIGAGGILTIALVVMLRSFIKP